jgi:membrane protein YqaA with SNARE-associated domain
MEGIALLLSTLTAAFVSALFPAVNAEAVVLAAAALAPRPLLVPLVVLATASHMMGKVLLYLAGSGLLRLPGRRATAGLDRVMAKFRERRGAQGSVLFVSALLGIPPFYLASVASGALGLGLCRFVAIGFLGRLLRFSGLALLPQLFRMTLP